MSLSHSWQAAVLTMRPLHLTFGKHDRVSAQVSIAAIYEARLHRHVVRLSDGTHWESCVCHHASSGAACAQPAAIFVHPVRAAAHPAHVRPHSPRRLRSGSVAQRISPLGHAGGRTHCASRFLFHASAAVAGNPNPSRQSFSGGRASQRLR